MVTKCDRNGQSSLIQGVWNYFLPNAWVRAGAHQVNYCCFGGGRSWTLQPWPVNLGCLVNEFPEGNCSDINPHLLPSLIRPHPTLFFFFTSQLSTQGTWLKLVVLALCLPCFLPTPSLPYSVKNRGWLTDVKQLDLYEAHGWSKRTEVINTQAACGPCGTGRHLFLFCLRSSELCRVLSIAASPQVRKWQRDGQQPFSLLFSIVKQVFLS